MSKNPAKFDQLINGQWIYKGTKLDPRYRIRRHINFTLRIPFIEQIPKRSEVKQADQAGCHN